MPSTTSARVSARARRASDSGPAQVIARAGLAARGVIYILIGWVAVMVALGLGRREADQRGALQMLSAKPYGLISLWLLAAGFIAYALWRLSEAALGVTVDGDGPGARLKSLGRAIVYAGGLDTALRTLRDQPYGKFALIIAALGLMTFGVYGLCEARWRKV